jgi:hypothetical protein
MLYLFVLGFKITISKIIIKNKSKLDIEGKWDDERVKKGCNIISDMMI